MYFTGDVTILPSGGSVRVISVTNLILNKIYIFRHASHLHSLSAYTFSSGKEDKRTDPSLQFMSELQQKLARARSRAESEPGSMDENGNFSSSSSAINRKSSKITNNEHPLHQSSNSFASTPASTPTSITPRSTLHSGMPSLRSMLLKSTTASSEASSTTSSLSSADQQRQQQQQQQQQPPSPSPAWSFRSKKKQTKKISLVGKSKSIFDDDDDDDTDNIYTSAASSSINSIDTKSLQIENRKLKELLHAQTQQLQDKDSAITTLEHQVNSLENKLASLSKSLDPSLLSASFESNYNYRQNVHSLPLRAGMGMSPDSNSSSSNNNNNISSSFSSIHSSSRGGRAGTVDDLLDHNLMKMGMQHQDIVNVMEQIELNLEEDPEGGGLFNSDGNSIRLNSNNNSNNNNNSDNNGISSSNNKSAFLKKPEEIDGNAASSPIAIQSSNLTDHGLLQKSDSNKGKDSLFGTSAVTTSSNLSSTSSPPNNNGNITGNDYSNDKPRRKSSSASAQQFSYKEFLEQLMKPEVR